MKKLTYDRNHQKPPLIGQNGVQNENPFVKDVVYAGGISSRHILAHVDSYYIGASTRLSADRLRG